MSKFYAHNSLDPFPLDNGTVKLVITSPPYFNLRNYRNDPRQIGLEKTPEEYVEKLVQVAKHVKTVLTEDGTYWLNIGDTYDSKKSLLSIPHRVALAMCADGWILRNTVIWEKPNHMPCSIKDRLTPSYEYLFFFSKNKLYYFDLDAIRVPHQTLDIGRFIDREELINKITSDVKIEKENQLDFIDLGDKTEKKGYTNTKLEGEADINKGARGGFAKEGETMENRYADGGKNPGDVFFTREDEDRAKREWGFGRSSARITARLYKNGGVPGHPLGKNPGDVHSSNTEHGETTERSSDECGLLDGFTTKCPACDVEFETKVEEIYVENPGDIWRINTKPYKGSHYAVFPPALVEKIIRCASQPGDLVLDVFSGSGTTAVKADELKRSGIGFDLSYDDVRERRVAEGSVQELILE